VFVDKGQGRLRLSRNILVSAIETERFGELRRWRHARAITSPNVVITSVDSRLYYFPSWQFPSMSAIVSISWQWRDLFCGWICYLVVSSDKETREPKEVGFIHHNMAIFSHEVSISPLITDMTSSTTLLCLCTREKYMPLLEHVLLLECAAITDEILRWKGETK